MQSSLDLTTQNPRSPLETFAGIVWLPRMADKARADKAGHLGDYMYPCPMDKIMLEFLELDAEKFSDLVSGHSDEKLSQWFKIHIKNTPRDDLKKANQELLSKQPDTPEKWAKFERLRETLAPDRKDIDTWAKLIDLEEGHA